MNQNIDFGILLSWKTKYLNEAYEAYWLMMFTVLDIFFKYFFFMYQFEDSYPYPDK